MELDQKEQKLGMVWFVGAGIVGLILSVWIARVDVHLTHHSKREQTNEDNLREVRVAASSLPATSEDYRIRGPVHEDDSVDSVDEGNSAQDHH